jgi:hypothetical protein
VGEDARAIESDAPVETQGSSTSGRAIQGIAKSKAAGRSEWQPLADTVKSGFGSLRALRLQVSGISESETSALLIYAVAINYPRKTDQERTTLWLM